MLGLCYTCLSQDRNVKPLDSFFIKSIIWEWFEAAGNNFHVNVDDFKLCWECIAKFFKVSKFKRQVFKSQEIRLKVTHKKAPHLINLSKLSIYTKNTYDITYVHGEDTNGLKTIKNNSEPILIDSSSTDSNDSKNNDTPKPENKKRKLSIASRKNKAKIFSKHSKDSESVEKKQKVVGSTEELNNNEDTDSKKTDTPNNDNGTLELLSILTGKDISDDVKLRSQPYVLINREEHKESSNHSKDKHGKRKHSRASDEDEKKEAKKAKTDDTNAGPNAGTNKDITQKSSDPNPDLPEVKFTIVHLTEEQMLETREIDMNDRLYLNRAFKCQTCIIGFLEIAQCEKHHEEKHSEIMGELVCPICDTRFKKESFLQLHHKTHYRSYRCRHCDFQHHRRYVIETHVVKEHELKPSPVCPDCDMEFDTQQLLMSHYEVAHKERLKCNICGECFDTYARVRRHAATHKGAVDTSVIVEIFHCARCNSTFEGKATYRTHMQFAHTNLAQNAFCADCDVQFSSIHKYTQHIEESEKHSLLGNMEFDCSHCKSKFLTKDGLLAHIVRAHRLLSQSCALCNKGFSDPPRLKDHIQAKHPEVITMKPVKDKICPICSKAYLARSSLLDHMRTHRAEKPFECKTCEKRFAVKTLLNKHIQRSHQEEDN